MNLTRADIRRILLRRGRYDLSKPDDVKRLDRYVAGFEKFHSSEVAQLLDGEPLYKNPKQLLEGLKWSGSNTAKRNEKQLLDALKLRRAVKLLGPTALRVALAFTKQVCLQWNWRPYYCQASNLITHDFEDGLTDGPRSVLILDASMDTDSGQLFVEVQSKIVSLLRDHLGATLILGDEKVTGHLDRQITSVLKPKLRLKMVEA
jgi:hypothetical protein